MTTKRPWTEGEWIFGDENNSYAEVAIDGNSGITLTVSLDRYDRYNRTDHSISRDEMCANARLIAAAPAMFEALADILDCIDSDGVLRLPGNGNTLQAARAALRAANPDAFESDGDGDAS